MLSDTRDIAAARRFFEGARNRAARPVEVTTDKAASYPSMIDAVAPQAFHDNTKPLWARVRLQSRAVRQ